MDSATVSSGNPLDRQLGPFRCRRCQKLLLKITDERALKPGEALEIKCFSCKTMNYLMGTGY